MAEAKKITIEITNKVRLPKSIHQAHYSPKIVDRGDVIEVFEDVADKLMLYKNAVRVTKESPASIKETEAANAEAERHRRANLLQNNDQNQNEESIEDSAELPEGEPNDTWKNPQIIAYAAKQGIDLKGKTIKAEMLKVIQETE